MHATFLSGLWGTSNSAPSLRGADMFLFPSATDTFGQVILEAQASSPPVIAVAEGGPVSLIEHRVSGLLCEADAEALAGAVLEVARSPLLRQRLTVAGLASVRTRTWERALARLGEGMRGCSWETPAPMVAPLRSRARLAPVPGADVTGVGLRGRAETGRGDESDGERVRGRSREGGNAAFATRAHPRDEIYCRGRKNRRRYRS